MCGRYQGFRENSASGSCSRPRVKLIAGMLSSREKLLDEASNVLAGDYGEVDFRSRLIPFKYTRHYEDEMGPGLVRQFISFKNPVCAGEIAAIKLRAIEIERMFSSGRGGRTVNIDPGYVSGAKLVLATTKNYDHRIYLGSGIFAEVTLHYRGNSFIPWEWTYPDYRAKEYIDIFNHIRKIYMGAGEDN